MRTPGMLIFGMVLSPCGWVLDLTSTVAPNWREIRNIPGESQDTILQQGIWDICKAFETSQQIQCNQPDQAYFAEQIITVAQGLMVASLLVTLLGLAVATPGVRCWKDRPNFTVAGLGGILIFLSGVMTIIPIAWYTHIMTSIPASSSDIRVGYCIVLGYIGGIMEVLGGAAMVIVMCSCCGGKNRGEKPAKATAKFTHTKTPMPRKIEVPSITRSRSSASSVPYSKDSLDDIDFPRAKTPGNRSTNTSYTGRPYDADL
ncbi:claudin 23a [Megalops cyprinoides]|uniref:claudin 23a n=1 Tax=Megalops cyprinoides TaxID=118141 RepID=UPI00186428D0|nr:claudin 23a [Megalops cyprinoides]